MDEYKRQRRKLEDAVSDMVREKDSQTVILLNKEKKRRELLQARLNESHGKLQTMREQLVAKEKELREHTKTITVLNRMVEGTNYSYDMHQMQQQHRPSIAPPHQASGGSSPLARGESMAACLRSESTTITIPVDYATLDEDEARRAVYRLDGDVERMRAQVEVLKTSLDQKSSEGDFLQSRVNALENSLRGLLSRMEDSTLKRARAATLAMLGGSVDDMGSMPELGDLGGDDDLAFFAHEQSQQLEDMRDLKKTIQKLLEERHEYDKLMRKQEKETASLKVKLLEREQVLLAQSSRLSTVMSKHREETLALQQKLRYEQSTARLHLDTSKSEVSQTVLLLEQKANEVLALESQLADTQRQVAEMKAERERCIPLEEADARLSTAINEKTGHFHEVEAKWKATEQSLHAEVKKLQSELSNATLQLKCMATTVSSEEAGGVYASISARLDAFGITPSEQLKPMIDELATAVQRADAATALAKARQTELSELHLTYDDMNSHVIKLEHTNSVLHEKVDRLTAELQSAEVKLMKKVTETPRTPRTPRTPDDEAQGKKKTKKKRGTHSPSGTPRFNPPSVDVSMSADSLDDVDNTDDDDNNYSPSGSDRRAAGKATKKGKGGSKSPMNINSKGKRRSTKDSRTPSPLSSKSGSDVVKSTSSNKSPNKTGSSTQLPKRSERRDSLAVPEAGFPTLRTSSSMSVENVAMSPHTRRTRDRTASIVIPSGDVESPMVSLNRNPFATTVSEGGDLVDMVDQLMSPTSNYTSMSSLVSHDPEHHTQSSDAGSVMCSTPVKKSFKTVISTPFSIMETPPPPMPRTSKSERSFSMSMTTSFDFPEVKQGEGEDHTQDPPPVMKDGEMQVTPVLGPKRASMRDTATSGPPTPADALQRYGRPPLGPTTTTSTIMTPVLTATTGVGGDDLAILHEFRNADVLVPTTPESMLGPGRTAINDVQLLDSAVQTATPTTSLLSPSSGMTPPQTAPGGELATTLFAGALHDMMAQRPLVETTVSCVQTSRPSSATKPVLVHGASQTKALPVVANSGAQCTLILGEYDKVLRIFLEEETRAREILDLQEDAERDGGAMVFHRFKLGIVERESSSTAEVDRQRNRFEAALQQQSESEKKLEDVTVQHQVTSMMQSAQHNAVANPDSIAPTFLRDLEDQADQYQIKMIESERQELQALAHKNRSQDKEIDMLREFIDRQKCLLDSRNESNESELNHLRKTLQELETKTNSASVMDREIAPLRVSVEKLLSRVPPSRRPAGHHGLQASLHHVHSMPTPPKSDLITPKSDSGMSVTSSTSAEHSEAVRLLAQNSLSIQKEQRVLLEQLSRSQQRVEQLEAERNIRDAMLDAKKERLKEADTEITQLTNRLLSEAQSKLVIERPARIVEKVVERVVYKEAEYKGHVTSFLQTVGNFVLQAQSLLDPAVMPQPLMRADRPLISHEHVEVKLMQLLRVMQKNKDRAPSTQQQQTQHLQHGPFSGEHKDGGVLAVPNSGGGIDNERRGVVVVSRATSACKVNVAETSTETTSPVHAALNTVCDQLSAVSVQTERPLTLPYTPAHPDSAGSDDVEPKNPKEVNFFHVEDGRLTNDERAAQSTLLNVKQRLMKLELADALDNNLRAAATFLVEENVDKQTIFHPEDSVATLRGLVTRTRRDNIRARIMGSMTQVDEIEGHQRFLTDMFKAFPSAFLDKSCRKFTPEMLAHAVYLLSEWWSKWTSRCDKVQKALIERKQDQLHRIMELCDLLASIGQDVDTSFVPELMGNDNDGVPMPNLRAKGHTLVDVLHNRGKSRQQAMMHVLMRFDVFSLTPGGDTSDPWSHWSMAQHHTVSHAELRQRADEMLNKMGIKFDAGVPSATPPPRSLPPIASSSPSPVTKSAPKPDHANAFNVRRGRKTVKCVVPVPRPLTTNDGGELQDDTAVTRKTKRMLLFRPECIPPPTSALDAFTKKISTSAPKSGHWESTRLPRLTTTTTTTNTSGTVSGMGRSGSSVHQQHAVPSWGQQHGARNRANTPFAMHNNIRFTNSM
eukprot:PhM_4_TR18812/c0_g1_i1/m.14809